MLLKGDETRGREIRRPSGWAFFLVGTGQDSGKTPSGSLRICCDPRTCLCLVRNQHLCGFIQGRARDPMGRESRLKGDGIGTGLPSHSEPRCRMSLSFPEIAGIQPGDSEQDHTFTSPMTHCTSNRMLNGYPFARYSASCSNAESAVAETATLADNWPLRL